MNNKYKIGLNRDYSISKEEIKEIHFPIPEGFTGTCIQGYEVEEKDLKEYLYKLADKGLKILNKKENVLTRVLIDNSTIEEGNDKIINGSFEYKNDKLTFLCNTKGTSFKHVLKVITAVRDECQRQIDNQKKCPYYEK